MIENRETIINDINNKINAFFNGLIFKEDTHTYFYNNYKVKSVSFLVKQFEEKVDFDMIAGKIAIRDGRNKEDVLAEWKEINDESIDKGKRTHRYAELIETKLPETDEERQLLKFWEDLFREFPNRYIIVSKETQMIHKKYMFTGTQDVLLYDIILDKFIVVDYKTNKDLYKNYKGKTLLSPFNDLLDMPFSFYELQLSLYQLLIEQIQGIKVTERWVVWIKNDSYLKLNCRNYIKELENWVSDKTFYELI